MRQAYFFYLMFFCAQPFIAHRLAAKQAVQACCKASSTGLLQSKQYRFAAKQLLSLLQSHQAISSRESKGLMLKIGISV